MKVTPFLSCGEYVLLVLYSLLRVISVNSLRNLMPLSDAKNVLVRLFMIPSYL